MRSPARVIDDRRRGASAALPLQRAASMTRLVAVVLVVLGSLASAGVARAQNTSAALPNGAMLAFDRFLIEKGGKLMEPSEGEQARFALNAAHCECSQADASTDTFGYRITLSAITGLS